MLKMRCWTFCVVSSGTLLAGTGIEQSMQRTQSMSSRTTWHNEDPGKIIREDTQGGQSGIREENQGEQSRRTTRECQPPAEMGVIQAGMTEKQVTWKERKDIFQNKTGSHETKPHCNPYMDSDETREDKLRSKDHLKIWLKKVLISHLIHIVSLILCSSLLILYCL